MINLSYSRKAITVLLSFLFLFCITSHVVASTCTWNGSSASASNEANWSGCNGTIPQSGDDVIFNGSSSQECTWDINPVPALGSFTIGGYQKTVTLTADLTINGDIYVYSGILAAAGSQFITVGGDWFFVTEPQTYPGDMDNNGHVDYYDVLTVFAMAMDPASVQYCADINKDGSVDILDVVLTQRLSNSPPLIPQNCRGGLLMTGSSTVVLNGGVQTIYGDNVFYNLIKTSGTELKFAAGNTQTVLGSLTLRGNAGTLLTLNSNDGLNQWNIDPFGTRNIEYADIYNMNNKNFVDIVTINSTDGGGNSSSVKFGGDQCVCRESKFILACSSCEGRRGTW